ncbi:MAG: hypothetical protein JWP01_1485, partial [Myxococcales bacterium]|nr:hypothetical protein [Myxococcales bacterium]
AWTPPDWLALGGDFRGATAVKKLDSEDPEVLAFPMQADLYSRIVAGPVSLNLTVGLNGSARSRPEGADVLDYLVSRQHYLMYQRGDDGFHVRVGRFFPVFGLRSQDHTAYPRRYLDQYTLEEPYAFEIGTSGDSWEGHLAGFIRTPIPTVTAGAPASGATAYYERLIASGTTTIAGQARVAFSDDDRRYTIGAVGKRWWSGPGLLAMAEIDLQRQSFTDVDTARLQMVGHLSLTKLILPGYMLGAAVQRWAPDLLLQGSTRNALELDLQAFPWAHLEVHLLTRVEATGGDTTHPNLLAFLQLHYYL